MAISILRKVALSLAGIAATMFAHMAAAQDRGQAIYEQTCVACHGADGKGAIPGVPDFTRGGGRLSQSEDILVRHVMDGFQSPGSTMAMPAKGGNASLTEADARLVVKYLIRAFGPR